MEREERKTRTKLLKRKRDKNQIIIKGEEKKEGK